MDTGTYPNKKVLKIARDAVLVMAHSGQEHGEEEIRVREGRQLVTKSACSLYRNIRCEDHLNMRRSTSSYTQGITGVPSHVVLNPSLEELARHSGAFSSSQFVEFIQEAQEAVGPFIPWAYYGRFLAQLQKADEYLQEGKYDRAYKECGKVLKTAKKFPEAQLGARVQEKMEGILEKGRQSLAEARQQAEEGDTEQALETMKALKKSYRGTPLEDEIDEAIEQLQAGE